MRNARVTEFLGDGMQDFRLAFGELLELQEKTGVGPFALYKRLVGDDWLIGDIWETVRIGLIGGGMKPKDAYNLSVRYVRNQPPIDNLNLARIILIAGLHGAPEEDAGSQKSAKPADDGDDKLESRKFYGMGSVVGYSPQAVDAMSLHQVKAAYDGYADHHSAANGGMTEKDKDDLFDMVLEEQAKLDDGR